jgi:hypothetical protein
MKRMMRASVLTLVVLLTGLTPAWAQRVLGTTTTSAAWTQTATTVALTSTTNVTVGDSLWLDSELVSVSAKTTTTVTVQRGVQGTRAQAHASGERVFILPSNGDFRTTDPDYGAACTRGVGQAAVLPWINARTGTIWNCWAQDSTWHGTNTGFITWNSTTDGTP